MVLPGDDLEEEKSQRREENHLGHDEIERFEKDWDHIQCMCNPAPGRCVTPHLADGVHGNEKCTELRVTSRKLVPSNSRHQQGCMEQYASST